MAAQLRSAGGARYSVSAGVVGAAAIAIAEVETTRGAGAAPLIDECSCSRSVTCTRALTSQCGGIEVPIEPLPDHARRSISCFDHHAADSGALVNESVAGAGLSDAPANSRKAYSRQNPREAELLVGTQLRAEFRRRAVLALRFEQPTR